KIYINGSSGISFSHIITVPEEDVNVNYVYSFFSKKLIDTERVFGDLKRLKILDLNSIIGYRSHVIKNSILYGESQKLTKNGKIRYCGRLGEWKNLTLEEALISAQNC
ncbi:hypothetical protein HLB03_12225, partial [Acidianus sp. DSM 29099]|nr:hypothetical protein [Acidianus sp. RZ1]